MIHLQVVQAAQNFFLIAIGCHQHALSVRVHLGDFMDQIITRLFWQPARGNQHR